MIGLGRERSQPVVVAPVGGGSLTLIRDVRVIWKTIFRNPRDTREREYVTGQIG